MDKLIAGFVLLGLGILVVVATIIHYATRMDDEPSHMRPVLQGDPDPELPDGESVKVTIGGGRDLDPGLPAPPPRDTKPPRENAGSLSHAERTQLDERGYLNYRVQKGDTLYKLAERYIGTGAGAAQIMRHNPELQRAEALQTGMLLRIPVWLKQRGPR